MDIYTMNWIPIA